MSGSKLQWVLAAVAALLMAAVVGGCGGDDDDDGADAAAATFNLTLGNLVPLTGDLSSFGPPGRKAADLAIAQATEAAEGTGITVKVSHADTETNPQAGQQAARQLIDGGATCLMGAWASGVTVPVATGVAVRQGVPLISPASTRSDITGLNDNGFVFRTAPPDKVQAALSADLIETELGGADGKTVSVAGRNDAYGEGYAERFQEFWEEKGGTVRGPVLYDPEQAQYNSEAGQIVQGDPDAVLVIDFPETYAKLGPALVRTGDFDTDKLYVTDGLALGDVGETDIPAQALNGSRGTAPATPETSSADAFDTIYKEAPGPDERQTFDSQNFDATLLCFLAAIAAGSSDAEQIKDKLQDVSGAPGTKYTFEQLGEAVQALRDGEDIDYEGVSGPVDFDDQGDPQAGAYSVFRYEDGSLEEQRQVMFAGGELQEAGAETQTQTQTTGE